MSFTVKASYRSETRRFSFPPTFPSFDDIYEQLVKVFPITRSFYLTRVFFSPGPDSAYGTSGTVLIGGQVDSEERYNECIKAYRHRAWPGAMLRFTVQDDNALNEAAGTETGLNCSKRKGKDREHDEERAPKRFSRYYDHSLNAPWWPPVPPPPPRIPAPPPWTWGQRKLPTPPPSGAHSVPIPPPPALNLSPLVHPMDIDPTPSPATPRQYAPARARAPVPQHEHTSASCCVSQGKEEIKKTIKDFMDDLDRVMVRAFGVNYKAEASHPVSITAETAPAARDPESRNNPAIRVNERVISTPAPQVHTGVVCDVCETVIRGIRHKCLDCPDYDMCTPCVTDRRAQHALSHEFFKIEEPGHVIVHTVFEGDGDFDPSRFTRRQQRANPRVETHGGFNPVSHNATCDLCDSRIRGDRYKCLNCRDFDTCASCFRITTDQHPGHSFVKVRNPEDLVIRKQAVSQHYARCDSCQRSIWGTRYKCMTCPDFDLCDSCESLPIAVHPINHHMIKMKTKFAIPTFTSDRVHISEVAKTVIPDHTIMVPPPLSNFSSRPSSEVPKEPSTTSPLTPYMPEVSVYGDLISFPDHTDSPPTPVLPEAKISVEASSVEAPAEGPSPALISDLDVLIESHVPGPVSETSNKDVDPAIKSAGHEFVASGVMTPHIPGSLSPVPRILAFNNEQWSDLWPDMKDILNNILTPTASSSNFERRVTVSDHIIHAKDISDITTPEIPTTAELSSIATEEDDVRQISPVPEILDEPQVVPLPVEPPKDVSSASSSVGGPNEPEVPLRATFLSDNNIPDGQVFPPGAEFMKSWKMLNDGSRDWPETTQLMFVAGDKLTTENHQGTVKIGQVPAGADIDVWTGEMKAPDVPGKYVSYWRLNDGHGTHFGHSLWADITVAEHDKTESVSNASSMAASSIIMPQAAPARSSVPSFPGLVEPNAAATSIATTGTLSDIGSEESDLSIIDVPSSPSLSSSDSVEWEETRDHISPVERAVEYVVLYDDSSDEE